MLDKDARTTNGEPLNIAGETGSTTMVDILMAGGVDVTLGIPLHKAALSGRFTPGRISMIEHPVSVGYGVNDFHVAAEGLLGKGPPLRWACCSGNIEGARWLLEYGASETLRTYGGEQIIELTKRESGTETVEAVDRLPDEHE